MDSATLAALVVVLETVKVCVQGGASASGGLAVVEKVLDKLIPQKPDGKCAVKLIHFGDFKIQCIKVVREYTGLGLKDAKELVEKSPVLVFEDYDMSQALKMYYSFTQLQAYCEYSKTLPRVELLNQHGQIHLTNY